MRAWKAGLWAAALAGTLGLSQVMAAENAAELGELTLAISGLVSDAGELKIVLVSSAEQFSFEAEALRRVVTEIHGGESRWLFSALPFGDYAIKVYHDANGNDELDKNFLGIPKEDVGFSNNPSLRFGEPSYDEARFSFDSSPMTVNIEMK